MGAYMDFDVDKNYLRIVAQAFRTIPNWKSLNYEMAEGNAKGLLQGEILQAMDSGNGLTGKHYRIIPTGFNDTSNAPSEPATIETMRDVIHGACVGCKKKNASFPIGVKVGTGKDRKRYIALFPSEDGVTESHSVEMTGKDLQILGIEVNLGVRKLIDQKKSPDDFIAQAQKSFFDEVERVYRNLVEARSSNGEPNYLSAAKTLSGASSALQSALSKNPPTHGTQTQAPPIVAQGEQVQLVHEPTI